MAASRGAANSASAQILTALSTEMSTACTVHDPREPVALRKQSSLRVAGLYPGPAANPEQQCIRYLHDKYSTKPQNLGSPRRYMLLCPASTGMLASSFLCISL